MIGLKNVLLLGTAAALLIGCGAPPTKPAQERPAPRAYTLDVAPIVELNKQEMTSAERERRAAENRKREELREAERERFRVAEEAERERRAAETRKREELREAALVRFHADLERYRNVPPQMWPPKLRAAAQAEQQYQRSAGGSWLRDYGTRGGAERFYGAEE